MQKENGLVRFSIEKPKQFIVAMVIITIIFSAMISMVKVDTDPENMLSEDEAIRIFHNQVKKEFVLHDFIVLGLVNEKHPDGVFNPTTLKRVEELTEFAQTLYDTKDPEKHVVKQDIIAPGNVDIIEQAGAGTIRFKWMMKKAPENEEEARLIGKAAMDNPLLKGTLVSEDGKALCIYIPVTSKDFAYQVRKRLLSKIETFSGDEEYYITGLPVAEDTFGVEMFIQMAVCAPLAMLAIFLLMLVFFRKLILIVSPLIVAMVSVLCTMGLFIVTGNTLHIMSSMIPIFLMPIAVVDSVHFLSEFFDVYPKIKDRRKTIVHVMHHLFKPMLYTSLTSSAGFASLALTPIPPVRYFGIFVAIGIMLAWILTIMFLPAYLMLIKEEKLLGFGSASANKKESSPKESVLVKILRKSGKTIVKHSKLVITVSLILVGIAVFGITKIEINDNPVKWFEKDHPIRVADKVLNSHFGGTYEAYLVLEGIEEKKSVTELVALLKEEIEQKQSEYIKSSHVFQNALSAIDKLAFLNADSDKFFSALENEWEPHSDKANDSDYEIWAELYDVIDKIKETGAIFKNPEVLRYIEQLQLHLLKSGVVGKSNSVTDLVKKVHKELFSGSENYFKVPDKREGVAQCLISFQNSHKPGDLWHLVTPDYKKANIWVQLKSGDNKDMEAVVKAVDQFISDSPPPVLISHKWAGLTYLNVVWQNKMVSGMRDSFLSSFVVVFIMMSLLFRSPVWGLLSMIPLTVTIALIYGIIGLSGKNYDMPVAVLSSLALGLAIDFAIHFLQRARESFKKFGNWQDAAGELFEEPARAITRNVIVIAIGFMPLLAAPLIPYKTVGLFLASIMAISGIGTLFILTALVTMFKTILFKK